MLFMSELFKWRGKIPQRRKITGWSDYVQEEKH